MTSSQHRLHNLRQFACTSLTLLGDDLRVLPLCLRSPAHDCDVIFSPSLDQSLNNLELGVLKTPPRAPQWTTHYNIGRLHVSLSPVSPQGHSVFGAWGQIRCCGAQDPCCRQGARQGPAPLCSRQGSVASGTLWGFLLAFPSLISLSCRLLPRAWPAGTGGPTARRGAGSPHQRAWICAAVSPWHDPAGRGTGRTGTGGRKDRANASGFSGQEGHGGHAGRGGGILAGWSRRTGKRGRSTRGSAW